MSNANLGDDLRVRIRSLRERFDRAVRAFEENDMASAAEVSEHLYGETMRVFDDLCADYRNALVRNKLSDLSQTRETIHSIINEDRPDADRFVRYLSELDRALGIAEKEVRHNYPVPSRLGSIVRRHWLKISAALILTGCLFLAATIWRAASVRDRGLTGVYYADKTFSSVFLERLDHEIDFDWGNGSPASGMKRDEFSVRWSGFLQAPKDGPYEFTTESDDGVRLIIDGKTVIENWTVHRAATNRGALSLSAGPHPIVLEYFENRKRAVIRLFWKPPAARRPVIIAPSFLSPSERAS